MTLKFNNLVKIRRKNNLRQSDVAPIVGVCRNAYSKKERGQLGISLEEAYKLSRFYNTTIDELFFGNIR